MPSVLITTSRKTSNRVRTFVRDLWATIPDSERFNRGGLGLKELAARMVGEDYRTLEPEGIGERLLRILGFYG